jgi:AraC family transcriptional regulator
MKTDTQSRYADRINRVVELIAGRLDDPPSLAELAAAAAVSPFHFHRIYRAMTGETTAETTRRLRLARAARLLSEAARTVTDIAFEVGYESSQAFAKAFRAAAGVSASEARREPDRLVALADALAKPTTAQSLRPMAIEVVSLEPFEVAAVRAVGPVAERYGVYGALFGWLETKGLLPRVRGVWGVPHDDPISVPEEQADFECCVDLGGAFDDEPAKGVRALTVGGGQWASARHVGPYETLEQTYAKLYSDLVAASAWEIEDREPLHHYIDTPDDAPPEKRRTDVLVAVRPAAE